MKQNTVKVKERYNWPVTILLIIGIVLVILLPLYMALMIAIKDPTDMNNILALPRKIRLQNFADAWVMTNFPRKFLNTAFITVVNLIFTLITNSFAAYAITRNRKKSKFFSLMYYYFISAMFIPFQVIMLPLVVQANAFPCACPVVSGQIVPAERNLACISGCGNRHFARCTCDDGMASPQKYLITCFAKEEL